MCVLLFRKDISHFIWKHNLRVISLLRLLPPVTWPQISSRWIDDSTLSLMKPACQDRVDERHAYLFPSPHPAWSASQKLWQLIFQVSKPRGFYHKTTHCNFVFQLPYPTYTVLLVSINLNSKTFCPTSVVNNYHKNPIGFFINVFWRTSRLRSFLRPIPVPTHHTASRDG